MTTFSRAQAAQLLGISERTLSRWLRAGKIQGEKTGAGRFAEVRFTREGLGREPSCSQSAQDQAVPSTSKPLVEPSKPILERPQSPAEQRADADADFAARFLRNEVPDSLGNFHDGTNRFFSQPTSALGPMEPQPRVNPSTTAHMNSALIGDCNAISADSDDHPLNVGRTIPRSQTPMHPNAVRNLLLQAYCHLPYVR